MSGVAAADVPATVPPGLRRARLGRYALYQLRDFALERLAGVVIVLGLLGYLAYLAFTSALAAATGTRDARDIAMRIIVTLLSQSWLLLALVSVNGLVSTDRATGRYRFLFAKPLVPGRYYAQAFAVNGVGMLACVAIAAVVIMALTAFDPPRLARALLAVGAGYLCVGGICFMMSAAWRLDWLATGALIAVGMLVRMRSDHPVFQALLPPTHLVGEQLGRLAVSAPLQQALLLHVALYGAACVAIGLFVLHRRPLAR